MSRITLHQSLINRLVNCRLGKKGYRDFEKICEDVLTYLFVPPLMGPLTQSETRSKLRKRDFIFENREFNADENWGKINYMFKSHLILMDAKNYDSSEINQDTVHDVTKYLGGPRGNFALILSSKVPEHTAIEECHLIYKKNKHLILIITKDHLIEMIISKSRGEDPSDLIIDMIYSFFTECD